MSNTATSCGLCWDLGDVIFTEDTEIKTPEGVTLEVELVPGIGELLRDLAAGGTPMAIVSDTAVGSCENVLGPHDLTGCFTHWSISAVLGVEKPHPIMFTSAVEALRLPPSRLAMIGNNYHRDIEGAAAAGLTPIWFHWNDRYPAPPGASAARYEARDAAELAVAINEWMATLSS
jgi:FMN phosphatase YigB (HAD superfamily)